MNIQAYKILWWAIPLICLPITLGPNSAFDLQLHDTYFVFASWHIAVFFSLILGLLGGVYWILKPYKLIQILSIIHSIGSSLTLIGIATISILQTFYRSNNFELFRQLNSIGIILILIFLIVQIILITNVLIGLVSGKRMPADNK